MKTKTTFHGISVITPEKLQNLAFKFIDKIESIMRNSRISAHLNFTVIDPIKSFELKIKKVDPKSFKLISEKFLEVLAKNRTALLIAKKTEFSSLPLKYGKMTFVATWTNIKEVGSDEISCNMREELKNDPSFMKRDKIVAELATYGLTEHKLTGKKFKNMSKANLTPILIKARKSKSKPKKEIKPEFESKSKTPNPKTYQDAVVPKLAQIGKLTKNTFILEETDSKLIMMILSKRFKAQVLHEDKSWYPAHVYYTDDEKWTGNLASWNVAYDDGDWGTILPKQFNERIKVKLGSKDVPETIMIIKTLVKYKSHDEDDFWRHTKKFQMLGDEALQQFLELLIGKKLDLISQIKSSI